MTQFFAAPTGRKIAYEQRGGAGVGIVFLGGFRSDMTGTKAAHLHDWAAATDRPYLRFDYSGHGQSAGDFLDGCIGDWADDAHAIITAKTSGPQILVGSSMGGWIALLMARRIPGKIAGLIGIAAAPDFTEDSMWNRFSMAQKSEMQRNGQINLPSDYADDPYIITQNLITDGRAHLVLRSPLHLPFPAHFLQGTADTDVPAATALRILDHASGPNIRLTLVKGADHRFSTPKCLDLITQTIAAL